MEPFDFDPAAIVESARDLGPYLGTVLIMLVLQAAAMATIRDRRWRLPLTTLFMLIAAGACVWWMFTE